MPLHRLLADEQLGRDLAVRPAQRDELRDLPFPAGERRQPFAAAASLPPRDADMDAVTGWAWLVLYAVFPPAVVVLLLRQVRAPGADPPRDAPMPRALLAVLALLGGALAVARGLRRTAPVSRWGSATA